MASTSPLAFADTNVRFDRSRGGYGAAVAAPQRGTAKRYGAFPLIALSSSIVVEQGERLSLAQALDGIKEDFGASDTVLGGLTAALVLFGVVGSIPMGILADRWKRGLLLTIAMVIWTACIGLSALAPTLLVLFILRMPIGAVEANSPASVSLIADYYPVANRARMLGRYQAGAAIGGLVGVGLAGPLVDAFGWRAAMWMWVPLGLGAIALLSRLPEPERGAQDRAFHVEERERREADTIAGLLPDFDLPPPRPPSRSDYGDMTWLEVLAELRRIPSMWFGLASLTISSFLLGALGAWGIEFFKREHEMSATEAGAYAPLIGAGAALGLIGGGAVADRWLRRGNVNARVHVAALGSIAATVFLIPALLLDFLPLVAPLLLLGALCLTLPVAPTEAIVSDVVPAPLRGRASAIRGIVRALSALAPLLVGVVSDALDDNLRIALVSFTPVYAVGGLVMLLAARTYPADLAFAAAEAERLGAQADLTPVSDSIP
jgi:MFS family permease